MLDAPDLADGLLRDPALRIAHLVDHVQEAGAEFAVARDGVCTQQRLHLPHLGPLRVVRPVGRERPDDRPAATFRTQIQIDLERWSVLGAPRSRRTCSAMLVAHLTASVSSASGSGSHTNSTSASDP